MPTVKISELPEISHLSTNTEATLVVGVDLDTGTTGKLDLTVLGEGLYAYQPLKVGENQVLFPNTIAQFSGNSITYLQVNNQNFDANGSSDYVASASDSDNTNKYIDMGVNGSLFSDPAYTSMRPYDGYVYVRGPTDTSTTGNLVIGTASSFANIVYIVGGTTTSNIVARMTKTDLQLSAGYNIKFGDGSIQSVAASPVNYSQAAFALANNTSVLSQASFNVANTASANTVLSQGTNVTQNTRLTVIEGTDVSQNARITIIEGVDATQNTRLTVAEGTDSTQNTWILATDSKMQSAFNKANNALANTSGAIFAGNLNIAGNVTMIGVAAAGQLTVNTALTSATDAAVRITGSNNAVVIEPQNDGYMLQITGKPNLPTRVVLDSFGANTYGLLAGRSARGSASAPTATQSGDVLLRLAGNGYGTTGFAPLGVSRIDIVAAENFTDAARGSRIEFYNVPDGTNTVTQIASFNANSATFTGVVEPQKGFIYTPRIPVGNQTAITIDYQTDSMIKANLVADLTVSHSNFVTGKVVEMWLVNTGGTARTITHGISATNSTTNSTTFSIPATSSAYLKFFSIDGDLANTFVNIVHA